MKKLFIVATICSFIIDQNNAMEGGEKITSFCGIKKNCPEEAQQFFLNENGTEVTVTEKSDAYLKYNTWETKTGKLIAEGRPVAVDSELLKTYKIGSTSFNQKDNVSVAILNEKNTDSPDWWRWIHTFYTPTSDTPLYPPIKTSIPYKKIGVETNCSDPYFFYLNGSAYYLYTELDSPYNRYSSKVLYRYIDQRQWWMVDRFSYDPLTPRMVKQHPKQPGLLYLYHGSIRGSGGDGYEIYNIYHSDEDTGTVALRGVKGKTDILTFDKHQTAVLIADNRYIDQKNTQSSPSYVKLYDINTNQRIQRFQGAQKKIVAIDANDALVAIASLDKHLHIFDRKTGKLIKEIEVPNADKAFAGNEALVRGDLKILGNFDIAFLLNTACYYNFKINSNHNSLSKY